MIRNGGAALAFARAFALHVLTFSQRVGSRAHPTRLADSVRCHRTGTTTDPSSARATIFGARKGPLFLARNVVTCAEDVARLHTVDRLLVFRGVQNRQFCPQPPGTDSQRSGKQATILARKGPIFSTAASTSLRSQFLTGSAGLAPCSLLVMIVLKDHHLLTAVPSARCFLPLSLSNLRVRESRLGKARYFCAGSITRQDSAVGTGSTFTSMRFSGTHKVICCPTFRLAAGVSLPSA
jgi:hypothetical protein